MVLDSLEVNEFITWFERSVGEWKSSRRYLYGKKRKPGNYDTSFSVDVEDNKVKVSWDGDASSGEMNMIVDGHMLRRDRGYSTPDPTDSAMSMIDHNTVVFITSYDGQTFREEIRLLNDDVRLRQTVCTEDGVITLVGQYFEERIK